MAKKNIPYDQKYYDPEIECMPRAELEAMQLERLQEIVRYAYDNTVYYKRSFDEAGVEPSDIKTLKDLEKFPFIDKKTERETQHVGSFLRRDVLGARGGRHLHGHLVRLHGRAHGEPPLPRRTSICGKTPRRGCSGRPACARPTATCTA